MTANNRFSLVLFCLSVGLALSTYPSGVAAQSGGSFKIRSEVDLVTVEVTALDKKGNPVRNLKKEDFQLYEDGKKQEILSIDEVNEASEASSLGVNPFSGTTSHRGKTVLIVFADNLIKSEDIKSSRDSAERFVREHMGPQDLFAVAKFDISMKILQNFTSDRKDVLESIRQAAGVNGIKGALYLEDLMRALDRINYSIAQIKGQKSILIYAQPVSLILSPATESLTPNSPLNVPRPIPSSATGSGTSSIPRSTPGSGTYPMPRLVISGENIYKDTIKSAIKSNVVFHFVEPSTSGAGFDLMGLASATGGYVINGDTDAELDRLDQKISNYYILGFSSSNSKHDGAIHKLEVKTPIKGLTLKYQARYLDRRPVDVLANTKQETALMIALASPGTATQLPIVFRAAYFYDSPRTAKVLVESRIRMEKATFKKKEAQVGTDLSIMGVAYGEDGSIAARFSETLPVSFEKDKETESRKRDLAYRNYLRLHPGKYRLKLSVSDESGNLGSAEQSLEVPVLPDRGFAGSSLLVAEQASRLPDLIGNLQGQMLDENNPLLFAGFQIVPSVENRMPANATLPVMFRLYNLQGAPDQWNLTAKARIIDEKGKEYSLGSIPLKNMMTVSGNAEAAVALSLSFKDVPPGKYRLIVETNEVASSKTVTLETDVELTSPK